VNWLVALRTGGLHAGLLGKALSVAVVGAGMLLGLGVGMLLGHPSRGANAGAVFGLLVVTVNAVVTWRWMRRKYDPARARAEGERLGRLAGLSDDQPGDV
jgi:hypothetical protein